MGRVFVIHLDGEDGKIYSCKHCHTHLALSHHILSRTFHCRHGRAYLFNMVVNVTVGLNEERMTTTGMHTVADIFCVGCGLIVGWKYKAAHEKSQKYKEGTFILEGCFIIESRFKVTGPDGSLYLLSHELHAGGSDADDA